MICSFFAPWASVCLERDDAGTLQPIVRCLLISVSPGPVCKNDSVGNRKLVESVWFDDVVINLVFEGGGPVARFIGGCQ